MPDNFVFLLQADPHRWGNGLIHKIDDERDQTMCGKSPGGCPGTRFRGPEASITCKSCRKAIAARERFRQWEAGAEQRRAAQAIVEQETERNRALWWQRYTEYLQSDTWRQKRARVMKRASGTCEGCGERGAAHVHHLRYPQGCWPGSAEWVAQEKLFDLRAVCRKCHDDIHGSR